MRSLLLSLVALAIATPALAAGPYTPIKLAPAKTVTPPADLIEAATAFLKNVQQGDGDAIALGIADTVSSINGGLDLDLPRRKETVGPFKTVEEMLMALSGNIGGDLPSDANGNISQKVQIDGERQFIIESLTDGQAWGTDPMAKGAVCSYAYRSYDSKAVKTLAKQLGVAGSSFLYVDKPYGLHKAADAASEVVGTLETDRLYALDYDTDAPGKWIAVFLPDGGSGFANYDEVSLEKPYATGICFAKGKDGTWKMVAQASTTL